MIFFKEKYELKAEIDRANNEADRLSDALDAANKKNVELLQKVSDLEEANANLKTNGEAVERERDKLRNMVREQTEADLLVNALKGLGIVPKPEKYDAFKEQERLYAAQREAAAMRSASSYTPPLGSLGDLLGRAVSRRAIC